MRLPVLSIEKPVFATVLNLIILLLGILCCILLPLRYQPKVFSPSMFIMTQYPGASAEVVEKAITDKLEESLATVPNLDTMKSFSLNGRSHISLKFKDISQTDFLTVQSRVLQAIAETSRDLPDNITPKVRSGGDDDTQIYFYGFSSKIMSPRVITDYLNNNIVKMLSKIPGVSQADVFGPSSAVRVNIKPNQLARYNITIPELISVLNDNNKNNALGEIITDSQDIIINSSMDIGHIDKLRNLVIKNINGELIKLSQVASVVLGSQDLSQSFTSINGSPGAGLSISVTDDANPIAVGKDVTKTLQQLKAQFPLGLTMTRFIDTPKIMKLSLDEVSYAIIESIILVSLITLIFLGNFKLSLIPVVTIPICLLGTCIFLLALGYSFNIFTLLALVLAVGLVVDDAIVVLENTYRYATKKGISAKQAAKLGSSEIGFAIVGMTICLIAVYLPVVLLKSRTAAYFQEFALTLAGAVFISGFISLTLSPVMCSLLLKSKNKNFTENKYQVKLDNITLRFQNFYKKILSFVLKIKLVILAVFLVLVVSGLSLFKALPSENMPMDQQGIAILSLQGPATASEAWNNKQWLNLGDKIKGISGVEGVLGHPDNNRLFSLLKLSDKALYNNKFANNIVNSINDLIKQQSYFAGSAFLMDLNQGFKVGGNGGGLDMQLLGVGSYDDLEKIAYGLKKSMNNMPEIVHENISFDRQHVYNMSIDRNLASKLNVPVEDILTSVSAAYKGAQLSQDYRYKSDSYPIIVGLGIDNLKDFSVLSDIYVKSHKTNNTDNTAINTNINANMLPLSDFISVKAGISRPERSHYNQQRALGFDRRVASGYTLGQAVAAVTKVAPQFVLPGVELKFGGDARKLQKSHDQLALIFGMGIIFVYLVLAALFESFIDPFIILLTVPLCIIGALFALYLIGGSINLYTGIGLLTLIGLVSKHGVLITQFANQKVEQGLSKREAILEGAAARIRPIIMTSLTMILGALPLALSHGAGSNSRSQLGWVIVSGLIIGTIFSLFIVPVAYELLSRRKPK